MQYQLSLGSLSLGIPLTWEGNPNFHIYMTGNSGQGKTYLFRNLARQMPEMGGRCIIFDYSGDFIAKSSQQNWPIAGTDIVDMRSGDITINPFLPERKGETLDEIAERVVALLGSGIRFGIAQWAYLYDTISCGLENNLLHSIADLISQIERDAADNDTAKRILPKIKRLGKLLHGNGNPIDWKYNVPGITIISLSTIKDPVTLTSLAELYLWSICSPRMSSIPKATTPLVLLMDECQRLRFKDGDTTVRILREGRKYGIWGWFSTQWVHDKMASTALNQAGLRIYFRPNDNDLHKTALKLACGNKAKLPVYERQLSNLKRGQFMFQKGSRLIISQPPA